MVRVAELSSTAPPPSQLEDAGIKATFAGYLPYSLRAEHIGVNSFSIVVRDVARPACEEMGRNLVKLVEYHKATGGQTDPALALLESP